MTFSADNTDRPADIDLPVRAVISSIAAFWIGWIIMSGLALAARLAERVHKPMVVFATAFDRFAISAFAVDAVGYLLKPVDPDRLFEAIARAVSRVAPGQGVPVPLAIFWAPHRGTLLRLESRDIDRITGEGDYARLHCGDKSYLVSERLYAIEERLGSSHFIRVHRSALVNVDRIAGLEPNAGGWSVRMSGGDAVAIGRTFLAGLRHRLGVLK